MRVTLAVAKRVLTQLHRDPRTLMLVFVVPSLPYWMLIDTPTFGGSRTRSLRCPRSR